MPAAPQQWGACCLLPVADWPDACVAGSCCVPGPGASTRCSTLAPPPPHPQPRRAGAWRAAGGAAAAPALQGLVVHHAADRHVQLHRADAGAGAQGPGPRAQGLGRWWWWWRWPWRVGWGGGGAAVQAMWHPPAPSSRAAACCPGPVLGEAVVPRLQRAALARPQVDNMTNKHAIFMTRDGRISLAGLSSAKVRRGSRAPGSRHQPRSSSSTGGAPAASRARPPLGPCGAAARTVPPAAACWGPSPLPPSRHPPSPTPACRGRWPTWRTPWWTRCRAARGRQLEAGPAPEGSSRRGCLACLSAFRVWLGAGAGPGPSCNNSAAACPVAGGRTSQPASRPARQPASVQAGQPASQRAGRSARRTASQPGRQTDNKAASVETGHDWR
jgi:hypothetical protein